MSLTAAAQTDPMEGKNLDLTNFKEPVGTVEIDGSVYALYDDFAALDKGAAAEKVVICEEAEGLPVREIDYGAFERNDKLREVVIPDSVNVISSYAFGGCTALEMVTIPGSVEYILPEAFSGCTALETVFMGEGVTGIDFMAFIDCESLTNVMLPGSLKSIGDGCFLNDTKLTQVIMPDGLEYIGDAAVGYYYDSEDMAEKPYGCGIIAKSGTLGASYAEENGMELSEIPAVYDIDTSLPDINIGGEFAPMPKIDTKDEQQDKKLTELDKSDREFAVTIGVVAVLIIALTVLEKALFKRENKYDQRGNRIDQ